MLATENWNFGSVAASRRSNAGASRARNNLKRGQNLSSGPVFFNTRKATR